MVGANYDETEGAITKKDSVNKRAIARKEAEEIIHILSSMINKSSGVVTFFQTA